MREDGQNGGPYISHSNILNSRLSEKYDLVPFYNPNARKMRRPGVFFKAVKDIKSINPDLAHISGLQTEGFLLALACKTAGVKTVVAVHGSATQAIGIGKLRKTVFNIMEKLTLSMARASFGVSDYVFSWKNCRKARNYRGTVYNIPTFAEQKQATAHIRSELGIKEDDIVFASTGRITRDKGFDTLFEVMKSLSDNEKIKFIIAGDGEYLPTLKSEISAAGHESKVFLLGYRADVDAILKEADAFIICTKHETLCISLLEAAHNSLPLVASNVGGIPEIINNGKNGYLIDPYDVGGFSAAVSELAANKEMRTEMGSKAKALIEERFSEEKIIARLDEIYRSVIGVNNV